MNERLVHRMRRSLDEPVPSPVWPKGVRLVPFMPDDHARRIHSLLVTAYAHGGGSVAAFDVWWPRLRGDAQFDPALCLVAVNENNDVAGVAQCWTSAFIKDLAVAPAYRRQGLGAALLHEACRVFRERGAAFIELKVEADNPSGALLLYRAHGFEEVESYRLA